MLPRQYFAKRLHCMTFLRHHVTSRFYPICLGDVLENDVTTMATIGDDADSLSSNDEPKPPGDVFLPSDWPSRRHVTHSKGPIISHEDDF